MPSLVSGAASPGCRQVYLEQCRKGVAEAEGGADIPFGSGLLSTRLGHTRHSRDSALQHRHQVKDYSLVQIDRDQKLWFARHERLPCLSVCPANAHDNLRRLSKAKPASG